MITCTGLSAFPLTPLRDDAVDERAFAAQVARVAAAGVDSIAALGSTGIYPYLNRSERARVARLAVENADGLPVIVGVGALRTSHVLAHVDDAVDAGASAVLLPAMSYHPLTDDDVVGLVETVAAHSPLPVIVYDNPGTTHVTFTPELYAQVARVPGVASIKIPGVPTEPAAAREHVARIRVAVGENVTIGVSGDPFATAGLAAGCDAWYSVIAGTLPEVAVRLARPALAGNAAEAEAVNARLAPLWRLFTEMGGSIRVIAAIAERLGIAEESCLPLPIRGLNTHQRRRVEDVLTALTAAGALEA
ncbi:dihydrodipicolinate synthase family protein [Ruania halotolerans]|uniref:dihydrodipicolinate synthase family protein n=1 Tax=Ruania halotolerans TaxID=2897773 RepID=UPI001E41B718|nr:dihydrodipicolinate synthase family protein [Ruania halotolerans]UFU08300.1 dihydrodipicolinate synthase family protein [Ruania halotolerans]